MFLLPYFIDFYSRPSPFSKQISFLPLLNQHAFLCFSFISTQFKFGLKKKQTCFLDSFYASLCLFNLKSNWQSVTRTVFLNYHLGFAFIIIKWFFPYLSLVVCYLMESNLCSTLCVHWTNPSHCDGLSANYRFLKSTIIIWVNITANLKTWDGRWL